MLRTYTRLFLLFFVVLGGTASFAEKTCRLPVPDGGNTPTRPNIVGIIVSKNNNTIDIKTPKGKVLQIKPPRSGVLYSAFGGDEKIENLQEGTSARVWFVNCRMVKDGAVAQAGYLEIYSNDPTDTPPPMYLGGR